MACGMFDRLCRNVIMPWLSPVGKVICEYLYDKSYPWVASRTTLWINDLPNSGRPNGFDGPSRSSPCILYMAGGLSEFGDTRVLLTTVDRILLYPIAKRRAAVALARDYAELKHEMVINKLKGK